jgi:hypothetical protein
MQIKAALKFHLIPVRMADIKTQATTNVGKDMVKEEHLYTVAGNINQYNHYRKQYGESLKN